MKTRNLTRAVLVTALCPILIAACTTATRSTVARPAGPAGPAVPAGPTATPYRESVDPPGGVIPDRSRAVGVAAPTTAAPVVAPPVTPAPAAPATATPAGDAMLVMHAAHDHQAEIHIGHLGTQRATNPAVRQLAQQLIRDHTQSMSELQPIAQRLGVTLPTSLDPVHNAMVTKLSGLTGQAFDIAFVEHMLADHAKAVAMHERMALTASDATLRAWAQRQVGVVRQHYTAIASLHSQIARVPLDPVPAASPALTPRPR